MLLRVDDGCFFKEATSDEENRRLSGEAAILGSARHPGVVHLLDQEVAPSGRIRLRLERVAGGSLAELTGRTVTTDGVARIGAALASIVADLHDIGVIHGGIDASHALVDEGDGLILCGFGRGRRVGPTAPALEAAGDVLATAQVVNSLLVMARVRPGRAMERALALATDPDPMRRGTARQLAAALARGPSAGRGRHRLGVGPSRRVRRRTALTAGVGVATLLAGTAIWPVALRPVALRPVALRPHPRGARPAPACPPVDLGCVPLPAVGGALVTPFGRFSVGQPGDLSVVGRWTCTPAPHLALLRPATGEVFAWSRWPARDDVPGQLVARVPGATWVRVRVSRPGCDRLEVGRPHRRPLKVDPA
jgi:hypothetical protein